MRRKNHVGMVDFNEDADTDELVQLCHHCKEYGMTSKLGVRQVMKEGEEPGPDWDQFRMCATCGTIYGLHEVKTEQSVSGFTQTSDNPFESQKGIVESIPKRSSPAGKRELDKRRRERLRAHHEDPEIDALLRIYGEENFRIIQ
jgi:hypothetical protein